MKKIGIILVVIVLIALAFFSFSKKDSETSTDNKPTPSQVASVDNTAENETGPSTSSVDENSQVEGQEVANIDDEVKPAVEVYTNAKDALEAVKLAAKNYDDVLLEQFVAPSSKCTWCGEFYQGISQFLDQGELSDDERAYFSELLAISGRVENIKNLVQRITDPKSADKAEVYSEALELAYGDKEMVNYLGDLMNSENQTLKESAVAAVTNHGDRQAIEILYKKTLEGKDPDGFYSLGIGLGEVVPDQDSIPYLVEIANKRDTYSHLAVKALMNGGNEGLRRVLEILDVSNNPENDSKMLEGASDHFALEDGSEEILNEYLGRAKNQVQKDFIQQLLAEYQSEDLNQEDAAAAAPVQ